MHTVIIGGGFAGVKAALELSKQQLGKITLVSNEPYFLHHAALYGTATGRETAASVVSLEDIFATHHDVDVVVDEMVSVDPHRKLVVGKKHQYSYDSLIIAIGMVTTYFNVPGLARHSFGIKTLDEVREFKSHLHEELAADRHMDKNYVVIGGGLTGVELAGALAHYLREIARAHKIKRAKISIMLVEAAPRLIPHLSRTASRKVRRRLEDLGVKVLVNHKVQALDEDTITIGATKYPTETAVWTSGVANHPFFAAHPDYFTLAPGGRVKVDAHLQAYDDVYVLGDNAHTPHAGRASTALHDAKFIARHLARKATKQSFRSYQLPSTWASVPVGTRWAYVEKYGVYAAGHLGHVLRRWIELRHLRALLPHNQAMNAWRAHTVREETCPECLAAVVKT
jgi:NADH dehydrogenase